MLRIIAVGKRAALGILATERYTDSPAVRLTLYDEKGPYSHYIYRSLRELRNEARWQGWRYANREEVLRFLEWPSKRAWRVGMLRQECLQCWNAVGCKAGMRIYEAPTLAGQVLIARLIREHGYIDYPPTRPPPPSQFPARELAAGRNER